MPKAELSRRKIDLFLADLNQVAKAVADRHGLTLMPEMSSVNGIAVAVQMTAVIGGVAEYAAEMFELGAEKLELSPWEIGHKFTNPETDRELELVGLDPAGGDHCVLLRDEAKQWYHMKPKDFQRLA